MRRPVEPDLITFQDLATEHMAVMVRKIAVSLTEAAARVSNVAKRPALKSTCNLSCPNCGGAHSSSLPRPNATAWAKSACRPPVLLQEPDGGREELNNNCQ